MVTLARERKPGLSRSKQCEAGKLAGVARARTARLLEAMHSTLSHMVKTSAPCGTLFTFCNYVMQVCRSTPRKLLSTGALGYVIAGLSSFRADVRRIAYECLGVIHEMTSALQRMGTRTPKRAVKKV